MFRKWRISLSASVQLVGARSFRSKAALEALARASEERIPNLVLYNYPSFSGAFSALFARLYHSHLNLPCLILPFRSVKPLRVQDLNLEGLEVCYLLDFIGPSGFTVELSRPVGRVVAFDHRQSTLSNHPSPEDCPENLEFHINVDKSSSVSSFDYFSRKFAKMVSADGEIKSLVEHKDRDRIAMVPRYIEEGDLCQRSLPDIRQFNIGLNEVRSQLNCITNPCIFDQVQ